MSIIEERNSDLGVIEGRFIRKILDDQAKEILADSRKVQKQNSFKSSKWSRVNMNVDETTLTYTHPSVMRFVDMKTRKSNKVSKSSKKVPKGKRSKKNYPVHNLPIMRHKKFIVKLLSFGFTESVKESFRKLKDEY